MDLGDSKGLRASSNARHRCCGWMRAAAPLMVTAALLVALFLGSPLHASPRSEELDRELAAVFDEIAALLREAENDPGRMGSILESYEPKLREIVARHGPMHETPTASLSAAASSAPQMAMSGNLIAYEYDDLNRVKRVTSNGAEVTFSYDAAGNRTVVALPEPGGTVSLMLGAVLLAVLHRRRRREIADGRQLAAHTTAPHKLAAVAFFAIGLVAALPAAADLPGLQLAETPPASAYIFGAPGLAGATAAPPPPPAIATQLGSSTEITPEIAELARALRHDVDLIYEYVYSQVEYNPIWGSQKGAMGALLDGTGNDFDQASLMIALLRASGYTASFVYGQQEIFAADLINWLGVSNDNLMLGDYMASMGLPNPGTRSGIYSFPDGTIDAALMERVWVKVEIDGSDYVFDPAFKVHTVQPGIDVRAAMAYNGSTFLSGALAGAFVTGNSVRNLNETNIDLALAGYAANLSTEIETNHTGSTIDGILGGRTIERLTSFPRQTSLPSQTDVYEEWTGDIPSAYRTTMRLALPGLDETFNTDSLSGKRLTIFYEANRPVLRLEGATIATGSVVAGGSRQELLFEVDHPFFSTLGDQVTTSNLEDGGAYLVVNSWTGTGSGTVRYHERREREFEFLGGDPLSEPVLGESLAVLGSSWMAQDTEICKLASQLAEAHCFLYHRVGVAGQTSTPYLDVPGGVGAFPNNPNDPSVETAVYYTVAGHGSAFEGGVIEQIHPEMKAVSTIALMGLANDQSTTFFDATAANFSSIEPQLDNYDQSELARIENFLNAGARVILPKNGNLVVDSWHGTAYLSTNISGGSGSIAHIISGGLKGGSGTTPGNVEVDTSYEPNSSSHDQSSDPIDLVTGDFLYESTDLTVGSQPFPLGLEFRKSYNSGSRHRDGPLGLGWTHHFDLRATTGSDGFQAFGEDSPLDAVAAIVETAVSLDLYASQTATRLVTAMLTQRWFMERLTNNIVTVSEPGRTSVFVRLPDGTYSPPPGSADVLSVEPDGSYLLTTKHGIEIDYDVDGRIESWQDLNGNTVTFSYSGDRLQSVSDAANHILTFSYSGDRISSVSAGARSFSYSYDGAGNLTDVTDANGETTTFAYRSDGLLGEVFTPANPTNARVSNTYNPLGRVETQLDANGQLWTYYIAGSRSEEVDPRSHSKIAYYDERGRTVRSIDALGFETVSEYDGEERLVRRTAPELNYTEFEYDGRHNLTKVTRYPKPGSPLAPIVEEFTYEPVFNRIETETDPRLNVTTYHYDPNGNLERIEQPPVTGGTPETSFTYNGRGQVLTQTDPEGRVTSYSYDPVTADLLTTTEDPGGLNLLTTLVYNVAGDVISSTDPRGNTLIVTPDAMRRVTQTQAPAPFGYLTRLSYDDEGSLTLLERQMGSPAPWQATSTTYTVSGKVETVTEPGSLVPTTVNQYDERDQLWRVTDAKGRVTEFQYDARGKLEHVIDATQVISQQYTYTPNGEIASIRDANGNVTSYRYDGFDRREFTDFPDTTFEQLTYDPASNRTLKTTRAGQSIFYSFDALNRMTLKLPAGSPIVGFSYDRSGRITQTTVNAAPTLFTYDAVGRRESVEDPSGRTVDYAYDDAGNRSRLTYPDGSFVTYEHDEMNRLEVVRDQGVTALATFGYDSLSRRTSLSYANGTSTSYSYEIDDDVSTVTHQGMGGSAPAFSYTYDAVHNRQTVSASDPRYVYDFLSLLPTTYTPNNLNQYTDVVENGVSYSLSYDSNGNLVAPPNGHSYVYDAENRLVSATTPSHALDFEYDAFGIRTEKTINGAGTHYVLDGNQVIAEYDDGGALLVRYVYAGLDQPIEMRRGATPFFYHQDALGSVVALSDAAGLLAESHAYGPYGQVDAPSGPSIGNPYLFAGREFDPETGLYYNRARFYDPALGRFLQPDPIGFADGLNLYAYVGGNPINFVDPLGLFGGSSSESQDAGPLSSPATSTTAPDIPIRLEGLDQLGIRGTAALPTPIGLGPAGSVELRSSTSGGAALIVTGGVGVGASVQATPIARTGLALTIGEIGPVFGVLEATFPTGVIPGTVGTLNFSASLFPLGIQISGRVGLGAGQSSIAGIRVVIPLSTPAR